MGFKCPVIAICFFILGTSVVAAPSPLESTRGIVSMFDDNQRIFLGRVIDVTLPLQQPDRQIKLPTDVVYDLSILCEIQGRVTENSRVRIFGRIGVQGSSPVNIPILKEAKGKLLLVVANVTSDVDRFDFAGSVWLPIGIETFTEIADDQTEDVKAALLALGDIIDRDHHVLARQTALELVREKNDFLWALGIFGLATRGTEDDQHDLLQYYSTTTSLWRILWLEHCFDKVFPISTRPSVECRHQHLLRYLKQKANIGD